ncbi:CLUMA_CG010515, isoform A [Clunio marinus]|uniref:Odorant receptor n=1 Tax=Clunio marinus TaxID=568069 RepID=A0A1J1IDP9_9DIPT|nr:CLUMA_CG010515, isoform A [Clunio marinus]
MNFDLVKKLMGFFGIHPEKTKDSRQIIRRRFFLVILFFFNIFPMSYGTVWNILSHQNINAYAEHIMVNAYNISGYMKYCMLIWNLEDYSKIFKTMTDLVPTRSMTKSDKNRKSLYRVIRSYVLFLCTSTAIPFLMLTLTDEVFKDVLKYPFDFNFTPFKEVVHTMGFLTGMTFGALNFTTHICFYSCCIQVITLYDYLTEQVLEVNTKPENEKEIIRNSVEFHMKTKEIIRDISSNFHGFLLSDVLSYIIMLGTILFNLSYSLIFIRLATYSLSSFYGSWIFCNGGNILILQSQEMAVKLYTEIHWPTINSPSLKRSLIIMIMNFQKPVQMILFKMRIVDLELFIFIVQTAYTLFNVMIKLNY